jgi:plastocyanin
MTIKRLLTGSAAVLAATLAAASVAAGAPGTASIVIRHQLRGCHTWSVDGGAFKAGQTVDLGAKGTLTITNNDMMPHTLVKTSGPAVRLQGNRTMGHIGAVLKATFPTAGTYVFTTTAGEDYMPMKTIGPDNVLRLVVNVR